MKTETKLSVLFWTLWCAFMCICSYFVIAHAAWLGGDEAIVAGATGWCKPIVQYGSGMYSLGRFFPFSYTLYNILPFFFDGQISPTIIYTYHAIFLMVCGLFMTILTLKIAEGEKSWVKYALAFSVLVLVVGRVYDIYYQCFTGMWIVFSLLPIFLYTLYRFDVTKNWMYGGIALLVTNYIIYCYETLFTIPLTIGLFALLFQWKRLSLREKSFYGLLTLSAIIFLALYVFWIMPQVVSAYDGGHGSDSSILSNAFKMFFAQKTMWVVLVLLIIRAVDIFRNKSPYELFDGLLLASCAYCCGAAALKLNFTYYYNVGVLCAIPAILYYSLRYLKDKWTIALFVVLALFYGRKITGGVKNLKSRDGAKKTYTELALIASEQPIYFFAPQNEEMTDNDKEGRNWHHAFTQTIVGWYASDPNFIIQEKNVFDGTEGLWSVYKTDEVIFLKNDSCLEPILTQGDLKFYQIGQ